MKRHIYDNHFAPDNVYGHAYDLLLKHGADHGVHIDIGCGFGRIAEQLTQGRQVVYVGVDNDTSGLTSLKDRGFETAQFALSGTRSDIEALNRALAGRKLASLSIIDVLEHLPQPELVLQNLFEFAREHNAPLVVSVPNVAHADIAFKLAFGRWDYTPSGLLDHTHLRCFTESFLSQLARTSGWTEVAAFDVKRAHSDQHFPLFHPAVAAGNLFRRLLAQGAHHEHHDTVQLVRAFLPSSPKTARINEDAADVTQPFFTIVTRTQGRRPHTLREVALCLAAQSETNFEWLICGHRLDEEHQIAVEKIIEDQPESLRAKTQLVLVDSGNRTAPLVAGFNWARGEYVVMLDDDDIVFANWLSTFRELATNNPGQLLRAVCVRQEYSQSAVNGEDAARATSSFKRDYASEFDLFQHLHINNSPNHSVAFPRRSLKAFGLSFDESLTTTEDWDLLMRTAFICGVANSTNITSIYRWWQTQDNSRTAHQLTEWQHNEAKVRAKFDQQCIVLPPGSASRLRAFHLGRAARTDVPGNEETDARLQLLRLFDSRAWYVTKPLRIAGRLFGNPPPITVAQAFQMSGSEASEMAHLIHNSLSFRAIRATTKVPRLLAAATRVILKRQ